MNACDPIVSTGLSESILKNKKETSRQKKMISCKGKTRASKNNPSPKLLRFLGLNFYLLGEQNSPQIFRQLDSNGGKYSHPLNLIDIGEIVRKRNLLNNVSLFAL